jgi:RNA polymerase sigma-70 factor (ECF subfamily)
MGVNDNDTIKRLKSKNRATKRKAFEEVYSLYADKLATFCAGYTGDSDAALDIVQDVLVKFNELLESDYQMTSIKGLLFVIAKNFCLNQCRDNNRTMVDFESYSETIPAEEKDKEIFPKDDIDSALLSLPDDEREIIILKYFCGYTYREIAELLDDSPQNVNIKSFRARKKLSSILAPNILEK